jgi:hypothetical protein
MEMTACSCMGMQDSTGVTGVVTMKAGIPAVRSESELRVVRMELLPSHRRRATHPPPRPPLSPLGVWSSAQRVSQTGALRWLACWAMSAVVAEGAADAKACRRQHYERLGSARLGWTWVVAMLAV